MIRIDLPSLVDRLNPTARHMLEEAASLCMQSQAAEIRVEHLLLVMMDTPRCDVRLILQQASVDVTALKGQLTQSPINSDQVAGYPSFSPLLVEWLQDSWLLASAEMRHICLRSGAMLLVLLMSPTRYLPASACRLLYGLNHNLLREQFDEWVLGSVELQGELTKTPLAQDESVQMGLLSRFCVNITEQARQGGLDPVFCRDEEIDLMIDILCRRRKNNPIVVGEAGVGKSALIEGLALRIQAGKVPKALREVELLSLDLGALHAGTAIKGEFEKRFKGLMNEISLATCPVILFIDEAHTLIGSGNMQDGPDLSNLLKPALARGQLRAIAATTWREYKKYVEKDPALSRRFQLVKVDEPTTDQATIILRGLRSLYEQTHGVLISEAALQAASRLSARYLNGRQLPDKAIDVLDTACARVAINLSTPPRVMSRLDSEVQERQQEILLLQRQAHIGLGEHQKRLTELHSAQKDAKANWCELDLQWQKQRRLVQQIVALRHELLGTDISHDDPREKPLHQGSLLQALLQELAELQQETVLVSPHVDAEQVAAVIADWTGVPLNRITQSELSVVTRLPEHLGKQIKGQTLAITHLHRHLLTARADLRRPGRPQGAFLLVGSSGVGKTETVLQVAELLFGGRHYLTTINMSEYQEKHTVSRLIGSPPGYVGFGEGGLLTEAIRKKPYSVVLLDEVEKAHPDVLNLFYQAFDKGELADGEGRLIDCQNVLFFLTSNLGSEVIVEWHERKDEPDTLLDRLYPVLADFFKPALLARMEVIPYLPLAADVLAQIVSDKLARLVSHLQQRFTAKVEIDEKVPAEILVRANRKENGARMLESVIDGALLPPLSVQLLQRIAAGEVISQIYLGVESGQFMARVEA